MKATHGPIFQAMRRISLILSKLSESDREKARKALLVILADEQKEEAPNVVVTAAAEEPNLFEDEPEERTPAGPGA